MLIMMMNQASVASHINFVSVPASVPHSLVLAALREPLGVTASSKQPSSVRQTYSFASRSGEQAIATGCRILRRGAGQATTKYSCQSHINLFLNLFFS